MIILLFWIIHRVYSKLSKKNLLNLKTISYDCDIEYIKQLKRSIFIRAYYFTDFVPYLQELQWTNAAEIFPQVDFVSVDCNYNNIICKKFDHIFSTPQYGYVNRNSTQLIEDSRFKFEISDYNSPQKFIDIVYQYDDFYSIGPPILKLFPNTTDSFFLNTEHPIFLFYN